MKVLCEFCKKNFSYSGFYKQKPICGDCLERSFYGTLKEKDETPTMKVSYNGFSGELVKLERKDVRYTTRCIEFEYDICIYDGEKKAQISFSGVKLEDVKFLGGAVSFGE